MKGRSVWTPSQIAAKARTNETKLKVLKYLSKSTEVTSEMLTKAMGWSNKKYAPRLLLNLYHQGLVTRQLTGIIIKAG